MQGVRGSNPLSSTGHEGPDDIVRPFVVARHPRTVVDVFSVKSRAIGSVFDELVAFFRPTYAHVREEKQRLELTREEEGDGAPQRLPGGGQVRMTVPVGYEPPAGPRRPRQEPRDSQGLTT